MLRCLLRSLRSLRGALWAWRFAARWPLRQRVRFALGTARVYRLLSFTPRP